MTAPLQALRLKVAAVAIGFSALAAGHAAAKNHDCQAFRLPGAAAALHDRAPSPSLHPN